ncbi:hypothetical protein PENSPDRAFT_731129 [Peniophora sp. CONT]|nr:hypothetical protein PENSPDRAFT_731129 [Peniophora sp. CONT]
MAPEEAPSLDLLSSIMGNKPFESILGDATDAEEIRAVSEHVWETMKAYWRNGELITRETFDSIATEAIDVTFDECIKEHENTVKSLNRQLEEVMKEKDRWKAMVEESSRVDGQLLDASLGKENNTSDFMNGSSLQDDADLQLSLSRLSVNPLEPMNTDDGAPNDDQDMFGYDGPDIRSPSPANLPSENEEPTIDPAQLQDDRPMTSPGPIEDGPSSPVPNNTVSSSLERELEALHEANDGLNNANAALRKTVEAKEKEINVLRSWHTGKWRERHANETKRVEMIQEECRRPVMSGAASITIEPNSKKRSRSDSELTSEEEGPSNEDDDDEPGISVDVLGEIPAGKRDQPPPFQPVPQSTTRLPSPQTSSSGLKIKVPTLDSVTSSKPANSIKKPKFSGTNEGKGNTKRTVGGPMRRGG